MALRLAPASLLAALLWLAPLASAQQAADLADLAAGGPALRLEPYAAPSALGGDVLFDNGPFINSPGTGAGGADESVLQSSSLEMTARGFSTIHPEDVSLADLVAHERPRGPRRCVRVDERRQLLLAACALRDEGLVVVG